MDALFPSVPLRRMTRGTWRSLLAGCSLALATSVAWAQAGDIDQVRAATEQLIRTLVDQGAMTRARADVLLREIAAPPAAAATAPPAKADVLAGLPPAGPASRAAPAAPVPAVDALPASPAVATVAAAVAATAAPAPGPSAAPTPAPAASGPAAIHVPYVPKFVREEMKEEIRAELVAQAEREGWAGPGAVPDWVRRLHWGGNLRTRIEFDRFGSGNTLSAIDVTSTNRNRATSFFNTTEDRPRLRVLGRLGLDAQVDAGWAAQLRLTTGSTSNPISSNQTLGNYDNRYVVALDRVNLRWQGQRFNAEFGRFGNPWFGTDLVWAGDLGFDGVALQWTPRLGSLGTQRGFLTVAALPVQEVELSPHDKWLLGIQAGAELGGGRLGGKLGLGYYAYRNIVGVANAPGSSLNDFTAPAFAQYGNTYFNISSDPSKPLLALASDFRIVNLTGQLDIAAMADKHVVLTADFARNLGFNRQDVAARVGQPVDPKVNAYLLRASFGDHALDRRGLWQAFFGYKRIERDAVLDAFTDGDFHLGGTDAKGFFLGGSVGLARQTAMTLRWLSADAITGAPYAVDVVQIDLSVGF